MMAKDFADAPRVAFLQGMRETEVPAVPPSAPSTYTSSSSLVLGRRHWRPRRPAVYHAVPQVGSLTDAAAAIWAAPFDAAYWEGLVGAKRIKARQKPPPMAPSGRSCGTLPCRGARHDE